MKSDEKPDNPRAFPFQTAGESISKFSSDGMTLLDYFIAHAPAAILWEFDVPMKTKKPVLTPPNYNTPTREIQLWNKAYLEKRAKMWPSEWAHVQLEKRTKHL